MKEAASACEPAVPVERWRYGRTRSPPTVPEARSEGTLTWHGTTCVVVLGRTGAHHSIHPGSLNPLPDTTTKAMSMTQISPARTGPGPAADGRPSSPAVINIGGLERGLREAVRGEVRFDAATKAMYANDGSNFRQVPIGVVIPRTLEDVVAAHRVCASFGAPVLNRGGGTSLSGETVNYAVVIDNSKYLTGIGDIDPDQRLVTAEPGVINEELNRATGRSGLVFGPDPSSHSRCTIGGNIGNNSCGVHSVQAQLYGPGPRTSDNTHALEIVTYDGERFWVGNGEEDRIGEIVAAGGRKGEIYARLRELRDRYAGAIRAGYPPAETLPRRVSGYNLDELLPEKGFNVARAGGDGEHLRHRAALHADADPGPARAGDRGRAL